MAFELEALVGHLYVAGGRTIHTNPPGALVEVAPRTAARGREIDTFFAMVLPSGTVAPNTFYEQMALMAAERYFSSTGSVTSTLREVFNSLNNNLFEHNASGRRAYEANMLCCVLRGEDLYVARAGACAMVLRSAGEMLCLPESLTDDEAMFKPPLGVQPIPEVDMKRFSLQRGARMLLSDASLAEIIEENLALAMDADDIEKMLDDMKVLVTLQIQLMGVEFVPPEETVLVPAVMGQSSAVLQAEIAAARIKTAAKKAAPSAESEVAAQDAPEEPSALQKRARKTAADVSSSAGHGMIATGQILRGIFGGEASTEKKRRRNRFITLMVFGFPAILVLMVVGGWVGGVGATAFEDCVSEVLEAANTARTIDSSNRSSVMAAWQGTLRLIGDNCDTIRPGHNDPTLNAIEQEALQVIDALNNIERRTASILHSFPSGANVRRVVLQGLDMYALDTTNNLVYRMALGGDGLSLANLPQPITSMRTGATVDGFSVGRIIDIDYDSQRNLISALDENGVLVSCRPLFINECDAQRVLGSEQWGLAVAIDLWEGRLYVLDSGAEQVWRYDPTGDRFPAAPAEYFRDALRPTMDNAVDFDISSNGTIYILTADGVMRSYYLGQPNTFQFSEFGEGQDLVTVGADALYLSNSPIRPSFLIASRRARSIYETTLAGTHMFTFRVQDDALLERLNDITADVNERIVYVASGNAVLAFQGES